MAFMQVFLALLVYILLVVGIIAIKPAFLFTEDGELKAPGLSQDGTHSAMAAAVFFPLLAAIVYYLLAIVSLSRA